MKKGLIFIVLIFAALISTAADRSLRISTGYTTLSPFTLNASDTIDASDVVTFTITNLQKYAQMQSFTVGLTQVNVTPNVVIRAYGKVTSAGSWVEIGTYITWTSTSNNGTISSTSPINYNYLKVTFTATSASQKSKITTFEVKTSNAFDIPANSGTLTISRATSGAVEVTSKDDDANAATTYRAGGSGALTLGSTAGATTVTSNGTMTVTGAPTVSGLITANDGVTLGAGDDLVGSSTSDILINTDKFTVAGATGNTVIGGTAAITGISTLTGGVSFASGSTVHWAKGGAPVAVATGTDVAASAGDRYWTEIELPHNATLTGLSYLIGSVGGTDSVMVHLYNSTGTQVATSKKTGAAHGDIVGTAAELQSVAFTATYAAVAGKYFAAVQFNGNTAKFRAYLIPGSKFVAATAVGTYDTAVSSITPGTSFVVSKGPVIATY